MLNSKLCDANNTFIDFAKVNKIFERNNGVLFKILFSVLLLIYKK